jgi:RNA polymerase sigma-70 factor (ECF subfamily)
MTAGPTRPIERAARPGFDPEPWRGELHAFVRRMGVRDDAEDVVQEAFLRALAQPPRSHPRAWLYHVALNVIRDLKRRRETARAALPRVGRAATGPGPGPAARAEARNLAARAWTVVRGLPDGQRLALWLRLQRHMDYDEIAVALACAVPTARQHFHLAVKAVRDRLRREIDG